MEYIFGKNTVDFFVGTNEIIEVFIMNNFNDKKILDKLKKSKIKCIVKDKSFFDKNAKGKNHQGIIATINEFKYSSIDEILSSCKEKKYPLLVVLDGIEDPQNLGAIVRTCEAFSVDGIILPKHNSCQINSTVAKVSTGALVNVKIAQVTNLTNTLKELKKNGFWVYAAEAENSQNYENADYKNPAVLVMGSEGFGISRLVKEQADFNISIKMFGKVNSLNVSVATAILVSHISLNQNSNS